MSNLKLDLTVDETRGVLEALQRFPMNQVRALVQKIEGQANSQLAPKATTSEDAQAAAAEVLNEVQPPTGPAVNG